MQLTENNWEQICTFFSDTSHVTASPTIPYCVFATVNENGTPRIAPYTSLILGKNMKGFYFDESSRQMSQNLERDKRICVLLVKNKRWFWIKTLLLGRFDHAPAIRLMGTVGKKRNATMQEINAFINPLKKLKIFKGYQPLWGIMKNGREIYFESFETVKCGSVEYLNSM
ncbi:MAG: pyridoxamine 5'-phosphate oxidase family protein [Deltaproteobacteria bacterium]|nr:pyridoxamine 5'-phosphate oxidase family protein [Deltaproteobacteria bacterium]